MWKSSTFVNTVLKTLTDTVTLPSVRPLLNLGQRRASPGDRKIELDSELSDPKSSF